MCWLFFCKSGSVNLNFLIELKCHREELYPKNIIILDTNFKTKTSHLLRLH